MPDLLPIEIASLDAAPQSTLVLPLVEGMAPMGLAAERLAAAGVDYQRVSALLGVTGKSGQMIDLPAPNLPGLDRLLLIGTGGDKTAMTDRGGILMGRLQQAKVKAASILLDELPPALVADVAAGLTLRAYRWDKHRTKKPEDNGAAPVVTLHVSDPAAVKAALAPRLATVAGTLLARDLVHEPPNLLGTVEFADRAAQLSALGVEVEALDESQMRALGMGALLGVAQGSARPPRLVIMRWKGGPKDEAPVAFVGKGVVFDSGGISIKQAQGMEDMKGDMAGAAAVTGLMHALAARKAKVNAVGVIGLVENMPSGTAMRPGDVLTAMNGTTIEIVNTDAEGRLVLADALFYTQDRFKPKFIVNLATLTGAIGVALGADHAGLFSTDDELATRLLGAGLATGEKLWRMPLGPYYDKLIESRFADIKNSGGRPGGAVTAASFLKVFTNNVPWAHLDIASVALASPATDTNTAWASGFGVALLERLVRDHYEAK